MKKSFCSVGVWIVIIAGMSLPVAARAQEPMPRSGQDMRQGGQRPGVGGRINSIDTEKGIIVVESRRAGEFTVTCDQKTKYSKDDAPIKLADLKEGDFVMVRGEVDQEKKTAKASEVVIRTGPPPQRP